MQHDAAFVRKALDDFITPYIKSVAPTATKLYVRSDGCKAQFKCAEAFDWTSRQSKEGCGLWVTWSFFESCHGKCDCDPEGGTLKNSARNQEMRSTEHVMPTTEAFFEWANYLAGCTPRRNRTRQRTGVGSSVASSISSRTRDQALSTVPPTASCFHLPRAAHNCTSLLT